MSKIADSRAACTKARKSLKSLSRGSEGTFRHPFWSQRHHLDAIGTPFGSISAPFGHHFGAQSRSPNGARLGERERSPKWPRFGATMAQNGAQMEPKGAQMEPKGAQKSPKVPKWCQNPPHPWSYQWGVGVGGARAGSPSDGCCVFHPGFSPSNVGTPMGGSGGHPYTSSTGHVTEYHDDHDYVHDHVSVSSTVTNNLYYGNMPYCVLSGVFWILSKPTSPLKLILRRTLLFLQIKIILLLI